jgi:Metallo-beta-lactamase superfamily
MSYNRQVGKQSRSLLIISVIERDDRSLAIASVRRLAQLSKIEAVLVGDGWQIFRDAHIYLQELID